MKNSNKIIIGVVLILVFITLYAFCYEPRYSGLIENREETLVFAHRGFGELGPDNSLIAATRAMEAGLDGVDVDGQFTKDNELVIFHDLSVDRLTSGTGKVADLTLEELRALDLADKYEGEGYINAPVASFEEFVEQITPEGILMVELKVPGAKPTGIEEEAIGIIEKHDAFENVYLSSFNPLVLYRLKKIDPRVRTVLIFMDTNWNAELLAEIPAEDLVNLPWALRQEWIRTLIRKIIKPDLLSVNVEVDEDTKEKLFKKGWPIFLWTPDELTDIQSALDMKPYGVITDEPLRAKDARDVRN